MAVKLSPLRTRHTLLRRNIIIFMFLVLISVRGSVLGGWHLAVWCLLVNIYVQSIEHLSAPTNVCSQLQLVSSVMCHGNIYIYIYIYDTYVKYGS
jgi:hypothetical protein